MYGREVDLQFLWWFGLRMVTNCVHLQCRRWRFGLLSVRHWRPPATMSSMTIWSFRGPSLTLSVCNVIDVIRFSAIIPDTNKTITYNCITLIPHNNVLTVSLTTTLSPCSWRPLRVEPRISATSTRPVTSGVRVHVVRHSVAHWQLWTSSVDGIDVITSLR